MRPDVIVTLLPIGILPIIFSLLFYLLEKNAAYAKASRVFKQILIGVVFGGIAILSICFGYDIGNATINIRDAAPLCAGLLFGLPAGIIAGAIGGVGRYLATVFFGVAPYSQLACSIATCLAGLIAGLLHKFFFDGKRPSAVMSFFITIVVEVIHLSLLFFTNGNDMTTSFMVIYECAIPLFAGNGLSVFLAVHLVKLLAHDYRKTNGLRNISEKLQKYMLISFFVAFLLVIVMISSVLTGIIDSQVSYQLETVLSDINDEIQEQSDYNLLQRTQDIHDVIVSLDSNVTKEMLDPILNEYNVGEISLINENGLITRSTNNEIVGFDIHADPKSEDLLPLLEEDGPDCVILPYQSKYANSNMNMKYGAQRTDDGLIRIGYDYEHFKDDLLGYILQTTSHRHFATYGFLEVISPNNIVIFSPNEDLISTDASYFIKDMKLKAEPLEMTEVSDFNRHYKCMYIVSEGYYIIALEDLEEVLFTRSVAVYITIFLMILIFAFLFGMVYKVIQKHVLKNIDKVNASLSKITTGHLDTRIDVRDNLEFSLLSDDINSTVDTLKDYIADASARLDAELELARQIQYSSLPNVFPAFPTRHEFDIYASMDTAKEVGGDFYDFYFTDKNSLAFTIADVSGKGIPAAMFMMRAKGIIKSLAQTETDFSSIMEAANNKLCEGNSAGLFITSWIGEINLENGHVEFINCGHNPPLLRKPDGEFEFLRSRSGLVLAGMEDTRYTICEIDLEPGSSIFLYTDGITEAININEELYGNDRLIQAINRIPADSSCSEYCRLIREDLDSFVGEADQFDDISMLMFKYIKKA